jgi:hypothetical protein
MLDRPWNVGDVIHNPQEKRTALVTGVEDGAEGRLVFTSIWCYLKPQDWHEEKGFRLVQKKGET